MGQPTRWSIEWSAMAARILIVEDDPDIAELVGRYLDKAGFTTERVASGREALSRLGSRPPDLLVLDLMLPHVDGLEICRLVRASEKTAAIPIIMLTAKEFLLLQYLVEHRGRVLSRDLLLTDVWGYQYTGGTRTVDVHVRRLREKLPLLVDALVTVKQFGYKLLDPPPAGSAR